MCMALNIAFVLCMLVMLSFLLDLNGVYLFLLFVVQDMAMVAEPAAMTMGRAGATMTEVTAAGATAIAGAQRARRRPPTRTS